MVPWRQVLGNSRKPTVTPSLQLHQGLRKHSEQLLTDPGMQAAAGRLSSKQWAPTVFVPGDFFKDFCSVHSLGRQREGGPSEHRQARFLPSVKDSRSVGCMGTCHLVLAGSPRDNRSLGNGCKRSPLGLGVIETSVSALGVSDLCRHPLPRGRRTC